MSSVLILVYGSLMLVLGILLGKAIDFSRAVGTFKVDSSDPDVDRYLCEIDKIPLQDLVKKRYVVFRIDPHADLSDYTHK